MINKMRFMALMLSAMVLIAGCQTRQQREPITITVNYPSVQQFYKMYGYAFESKFPHINVQVVEDDPNDERVDKLTDVIYMNGMDHYKEAIEKGRLTVISSSEDDDLFESGGQMSPIVRTLLASASSDSQLYGLAPTFHSAALYFNKGLFDDNGIPYPYNGMSWRDVMMLAMQFPNTNEEGEPLYGIGINSNSEAALQYILEAGKTEGLAYIDSKTLKVTMNTERWKEIWLDVVAAFQGGVVFEGAEDEDPMSHSSFLKEEAAMTIDSSGLAYQFETFSQFAEGSVLDWDMVTVPIDPVNPAYSSAYEIYDFYGVSSQSGHPEEALKLVKFIAGDPANSRLLAKGRSNMGLPAVTDYRSAIDEHDLSPFYSLKANPNVKDTALLIEPAIMNAFRTGVQAVLNRVILGDLSVDEGLMEVEQLIIH